jgi:hypothetical protein
MNQLSSHDEREIIEEKKNEINDIRRRDTFRIISSFRKIYNIIVYIRSSVSRTKEFKDLVKRIILFNNCTRWNSWFHIFYIAFKLDTALDSYTKKYFNILQIKYLFLTDWEKLRTIN